MNKILLSAIALVALFRVPIAFAQVTFYEYDGFRGKNFTLNWAIPNFDHYGYNDRASSAIVEHGQWQVCEDANFGGRCVVLKPGQYPSLAPFNMNNRISSVRPAKGRPTPVVAPPTPAPPPY